MTNVEIGVHIVLCVIYGALAITSSGWVMWIALAAGTFCIGELFFGILVRLGY